jgi:hypothetical protein
MNAESELSELIEYAKSIGVKIKYKQGWFWKTLAVIVNIVTFGGSKTFLTDYTTTLYKTIFVPLSWDQWPSQGKLEILTHELVHVKQAKTWTYPIFVLSYLLFPLPFGLAWARYRFEREAYLAGFKVSLRYESASRDFLIDHGVKQMSSSAYGWAWPFPYVVRAWFEKNL